MKLGLSLGYLSDGNHSDLLVLAKEADRLGYDTVWAAESWGSDVPSVLGWIAAQTEKIGIAAGIMQIPARAPAMTAMTAATLDVLSGGRFTLGLGLSGPQVSEGWYGVRYAKPLVRQREYVEIVRTALTRRKLTYDGEHWTLPLPDGPGKALHLMLHTVRDTVPIYLATVGPRNLELAGEIADGAILTFFAPDLGEDALAGLRAGREKAGKALDGFGIVANVPVAVDDDLHAAADRIRPHAALYVGGMGSREKNFYNAQARRMGFGAEAAEIQDLYLTRRPAEAAAKVPFDLVDRTSAIGPVPRLADRLTAFAEAGVTTFAVTPFGNSPAARVQMLRDVVTAGEKAGVLT
jgi:F420-dependent oxidoreductase-like protein